jgi:hypothetical protein
VNTPEVERKARGTLYLVSCATSSTPLVYNVLAVAHQASQDVHVLLTPHARSFVNLRRLRQSSGHAVWSEFHLGARYPAGPQMTLSWRFPSLLRRSTHGRRGSVTPLH